MTTRLLSRTESADWKERCRNCGHIHSVHDDDDDGRCTAQKYHPKTDKYTRCKCRQFRGEVSNTVFRDK